MKVLVTGGAGFIGSNFIRLLLNSKRISPLEIHLVDKLTYSADPNFIREFVKVPNCFFHQGDINDSELVGSIINYCDAIINFAAESHVDRSILYAHDFVYTNTVGVNTILEQIRTKNRRIRLIQISTDEVFGSCEGESWTEDSSFLPNSPYAASKAGAEMLIRSFSKTFNLDTIITRSCNNYGPYQFPEKLIPLLITNTIMGKKLPLYGKGNQIRQWIHVQDHCRGILEVLLKGKSQEAYHISAPAEFTNNHVALKILSEFNKDISLIEYVEDRPGHDYRYSLNSNKIKKELDFSPKMEFNSGLNNTIKWYQDNQEWWIEKVAGKK
jgi:dTDP-glucose 4,6-dehydratase